MKGSLSLGKIAGIKLFVHWTFLILIVWIVWMHMAQGHGLQETLIGIAFILAIFICVTLHELGHALTARRFHFQTSSINLLPIGGVALLEGMPEKPGQELLVAIMGPVVNVVIALLLYAGLRSSNAFPTDVQSMQHMQLSGNYFWFNLFAANLFLAVFNLIPAFPMDGGRVLRALLSFKLPRVKATKVAAVMGQIIAVIFVFAGFAGNPMLIFIGLFIYLGAQGEAAAEQTKSALTGIKVSNVLMHQFTALTPTQRLSEAVKQLLNSQEQSFVVMDAMNVRGILSRKEIIAGLTEHGSAVPIENVMNKNFITLQMDEPLQDVIMKMKDGPHSLSPIYGGSNFVGVIDKENITELLMVREALKNLP